jgi:hypothetical protein
MGVGQRHRRNSAFTPILTQGGYAMLLPADGTDAVEGRERSERCSSLEASGVLEG